MVHLPNSGLSVAGIRHFGKYIWNPATVIFQGGFRNFCGFTFQENAIQKCGVTYIQVYDKFSRTSWCLSAFFFSILEQQERILGQDCALIHHVSRFVAQFQMAQSTDPQRTAVLLLLVQWTHCKTAGEIRWAAWRWFQADICCPSRRGEHPLT